MIMQETNEFKLYLSKNFKSERTISEYIRDIEQFLTYFKDKPLQDINADIIERYKNYMLNGRFLSPTSVNRKLVAIHQFLTFCQIAVPIRLVKIQTQNFLEDIFESDDVKRIIEATENQNDLRAKALILTLQLTGMRISEALQLTINDIHKDTVMIIGKGNKRRNAFIPPRLRDIWRDYCKVRINKSDMLFTGKRGAITRQCADLIIKKYANLAEVDFEKAHCHNLRHYYCSELARRGLEIDVISDLAGHQDINTSRIYTRRTKKELLDIIDEL